MPISNFYKIRCVSQFLSCCFNLSGGGQSGHFGGGFGGDYNDEGDYFKRKKRSTPIEIKRQGFLADVDGGYGGYNQVKIFEFCFAI